MAKLMQGDTGIFKDTWGYIHRNCVVVMTQEDLITIYSPSYREFYRTFDFVKTCSDNLTEETRKMNFDYAKQHSGEDLLMWEGDVKDENPLQKRS